MARGDDPASATTSFFIVTGDGSSLDGKYTAFGRCSTVCRPSRLSRAAGKRRDARDSYRAQVGSYHQRPKADFTSEES